MPNNQKHTYENFPVFSGWPSEKVYFLENMAWEQHFQLQYRQQHQSLQHQLQATSDNPTTDDKKYVVITKDMEEDRVYDCVICTQKLCMVFNQDEEEWVFDNCKQFEGVVYHFPLCYEVGVKVKRKERTQI